MSTEGKDAATVEALQGILDLVIELLANTLKELFPEASIKFDPSTSEFKVHVKSLESQELINLGTMAKDNKITIKRSGTGITIIVSLLDKGEA